MIQQRHPHGGRIVHRCHVKSKRVGAGIKCTGLISHREVEAGVVDSVGVGRRGEGQAAEASHRNHLTRCDGRTAQREASHHGQAVDAHRAQGVAGVHIAETEICRCQGVGCIFIGRQNLVGASRRIVHCRHIERECARTGGKSRTLISDREVQRSVVGTIGVDCRGECQGANAGRRNHLPRRHCNSPEREVAGHGQAVDAHRAQGVAHVHVTETKVPRAQCVGRVFVGRDHLVGTAGSIVNRGHVKAQCVWTGIKCTSLILHREVEAGVVGAVGVGCRSECQAGNAGRGNHLSRGDGNTTELETASGRQGVDANAAQAVAHIHISEAKVHSAQTISRIFIGRDQLVDSRGRIVHRRHVEAQRVRTDIKCADLILHREREAGVGDAVGIGSRRERQASDTGHRNNLSGGYCNTAQFETAGGRQAVNAHATQTVSHVGVGETKVSSTQGIGGVFIDSGDFVGSAGGMVSAGTDHRQVKAAAGAGADAVGGDHGQSKYAHIRVAWRPTKAPGRRVKGQP